MDTADRQGGNRVKCASFVEMYNILHLKDILAAGERAAGLRYKAGWLAQSSNTQRMMLFSKGPFS